MPGELVRLQMQSVTCPRGVAFPRSPVTPSLAAATVTYPGILPQGGVVVLPR